MSGKSSPNKPMSNTLLCLTCSSSFPPRQDHATIFFTPCCSRPICSACIASNPRLERYNPCLRCLGGVSAVNARHVSSPTQQHGVDGNDSGASTPLNIDGGVHDENVFTVGDEDDDDSDDDGDEDLSDLELDGSSTLGSATLSSESSVSSDATIAGPHLPSSTLSPESIPNPQNGLDRQDDEGADASNNASEQAVPAKYYIHPGDTLLGISLKFGVDAHALCRMNNLPPSTIRTTPHLLHTRTFLTLPASGSTPSGSKLNTPPISEEEEEERRARRTRERAEKRLQTVTKEVDWRVAKAYVAVAEYSDPFDDNTRRKEDITVSESKVGNSYADGIDLSLESQAVDRYLDDDEWEDRERKAGRSVSIPSFPLFASTSRRSSTGFTSPKRRDSWMATTSNWLKWGS